MGLVLDTSAIIEVERSGGDLAGRLGAAGSEHAVVPAIVYAELRVGVRLADTASRAAARSARIDALVARLPIIDFDKAIADRWAELFANLTSSGTMVPANDLAVIATAVHLGFGIVLASGGESHFESIPGLRIVRLTSP